MVSYITTKDNFIRESSRMNPAFVQRAGISKKLAFEIFKYFKSLDKATQKTINFAKIKEKLDIPNYEGYELFLDIKNGLVEFKGEKILVKEKGKK